MERFYRFTLRHRRLLAATLTGLGVFFGLSAVTASPAGRPVVIAARDLDSGVTLTAADVRAAQVPPEAAPHRAPTSVVQVIGRITSGAVREGEVFSDRRTVAAGPLDGFGSGRVLASVRISDSSVVAMLRTGDTVDVIAVAGNDQPTAAVIARGARVVTLRRSTPRFSDGVPVGLAVSRSAAMELAARSLDSRLTLVATR
jgi:Flp pilus assembly protein CpaB